MNNRANAWTAIIEVAGNFRHDPPITKLVALAIVGGVILGVVWMCLRTMRIPL